MSGSTYTLAQFIGDIKALGIFKVYPYASLSGSSNSTCRLIAVDDDSGAIKYMRNKSSRVENISDTSVQKLVAALATGKAVEVNALYGGSGNFRSALEALAAHTPHVFLCRLNGKKHIYYAADRLHDIGQIVIDQNPSVSIFSPGDVQQARQEDQLGLCVGMQSEDSPYGVVTVLDDDDYSYQILCVNESKQSTGIRTISKILLKEWIDAVQRMPEKNADALRAELTGKTDVDRFEYGNAGVLIKLAKMATGQTPHVIVDVSSYWNRRLGRSKKMVAPSADVLTVALKMYAAERGSSGPSGWETYDAWTHGVREEFAEVNEGLLEVEGFDYEAYIRKYTISTQVTNMFFSGHTEGEKQAVLRFLREQKEAPKAVSWYLDERNRLAVGGTLVAGMKPMTVLYFLSELHPAEFAAWTGPTYETLAFLGLHKGEIPRELTLGTYEDCKGKQQRIVERMRELGIGKASDDGSVADYRTVNEFLWWAKENREKVQEEVMKRALKPVKSGETLRHGARKLSEAFAGDGMLKRLAAALRTKPFAILAGHSGTGKSQLVRRLAYMTGNNERLAKEGEGRTAPGNYCMIQVKPNWHDSSDLLGYYSEMGGRHFVNTPFVEFACKAYAYPETPFFVCLDEMNLAPVEQYFAEYLSAIESMERKGGVWVTDPLVEVDGAGGGDGEGKPDPEILAQVMKGAESTEAAEWIAAHGLTIPKNLFVVGTVNMDETTCQFSRKVLDRAMTLLMNEVKFGSMAASKKPSEEALLDDEGIGFFLGGDVRGEVGSVESGLLEGLNEPLANTAFVVAYRFANEYALYEAAWARLEGADLAGATEEARRRLAETALDHAVLMKLLPRIHGEGRVVKGLFEGRKAKGEGGEREVPGLKARVLPGGLSARMMDAILARPDEYLTFWP